MIYKLKDLVQYAFKHSPYYADLYANLSEKISKGDFELADLSELPIVNQSDFWRYNSINENKLLTNADIASAGGIVFKSGGTTGNPKFSVYTKEEWETFTAEFAKSIDQIGLSDGDRVANTFYSGSLYASFVFIMKSLEKSKFNLLHFPITGQCSHLETIKIIKEFAINTIVGVPSSILALLECAYDSKNNKNNKNSELSDLPIKKIFFGGESMFADQRERIKSFFPDCYISSIGYASVDGGHLGYVTKDLEYNEHWSFGKSSIMEIIDEETGLPIECANRPGKLVYTNLTRKLMPIIRYPVGDRAIWTEDTNNTRVKSGDRKFKLLGRSEEGARVGPVTVNMDDISEVVKRATEKFVDEFAKLKLPFNVINKQLLLEHSLGKDSLTVRLAVSDLSSLDNNTKKKLEEIFVNVFYAERTMFREEVNNKKIAPINFKIVSLDQLERNERTGKLKYLLDRRE
ncbi:MAG: phenylacetate--CoA ligase family protein [Oligoflexia bacterium]|nr:phenylacetate--CoA ligase family protein [Oligoflexia bacterium]